MREFWKTAPGVSNFVFLGEAGCGKSEIAINAALALAERGERTVHFFDMDMSKSLFRARDVCRMLEQAGVRVHYEVQFMDAPTTVGGVQRLLRDEHSFVVMDVGGDYIGARAIGGYAPLLNQAHTAVYYIVNSYRPWSLDLEHIDSILAQTLGVSHIELQKLRVIGNPNLGLSTTPRDVLDGMERLENLLGDWAPIEFFCAREDLRDALPEQARILPIRTYLTYPWENETSASGF